MLTQTRLRMNEPKRNEEEERGKENPLANYKGERRRPSFGMEAISPSKLEKGKQKQ